MDSGQGMIGEVGCLTLNLGLPGLTVWGFRRMALAANNRERLAAASGILSSTDADVIALQEVYRPADQRFLAQAMAATHPFCTQLPPTRSLLGNGLMLLSRFPLLRSEFLPCNQAPWWVAPLWTQGFLLAEIDLPVAGRTRFINVHLTAALPLRDLDAAVSAETRDREINQLAAAAKADHGADILIGDFNTGDEIYPAHYRTILTAGYEDAFVAANGAGQHGKAFTWDASNPVNRRGRFRNSPSQRIDHVFINVAAQRSFTPIAARIVLEDRCVTTARGERVCLSDHYGVLVTMALQGASPNESGGRQRA